VYLKLCLMKRRRVLTRKPKLFRSFRLGGEDLKLWRRAAKMEGFSQSEFLRLALRDKGERVLGSNPTKTGKKGSQEQAE